MVSLKLENFGGMVPAVNDYYLPQNAAALSQNAWVYTGAVEGFRSLRSIYTCSSAAVKKVFRIPQGYYDKDRIPNSYWIELFDIDTDVLRSNLASDSYERYYWASPSTQPQYNTKNRLIAKQSQTATVTIATPAVATLTAHGMSVGDPFYWTTTGTLPTGITSGQWYFVTTVVDANTFRFSATPNGTAVNTSGTQSGTHTIYLNQPLLLGVPSPSVAPSIVHTPPNSTVTLTIATPAVMTWTSHGLSVNSTFYLTTTGSLPTGVAPNITYYVTTVVDANSFQFSATLGGSPIATSGTQSGVHTGYKNSVVNESRAYIYTWVTAYGEEGAPSNPSSVFTAYTGGSTTVTVTNPSNSEAAQRNLKYVNLYRTVTSTSGVSTYFFVAQISVGTTTYVDATISVSSNNQLTSLYWTSPPSDLKGFINLPNGMVAGFRANELWFCEPYRMHAWPSAYTVSVDYPIIGIGVVGQTVIICTAVSPYAVSGVNPATMSMSRISVTTPCMSRGSVVSTASGVSFASPDGLVLVTPGGAVNLTRDLITKDKWSTYLPLSNLRAGALNEAYYCWGSQQGITFQQDTFQNDAFQAADISGGFTGAFIDFQNTRVAFNQLSTTDFAVNVYNDVWTGEVFVLKSGILYWLDTSDSRPHDSFVWRSKKFTLPNRKNLEAMRVWFDTFSDSPTLNPVRNTNLVQTLQADQWGLVRVYADDTLVMCRELRTDGELMRLPAGFKAAAYQFEIEARVKIISMEMASAAKELTNV